MFFFLYFTQQNILSNNLEGGFRMRKKLQRAIFPFPNRIFNEWLIFIKKQKAANSKNHLQFKYYF